MPANGGAHLGKMGVVIFGGGWMERALGTHTLGQVMVKGLDLGSTKCYIVFTAC